MSIVDASKLLCQQAVIIIKVQLSMVGASQVLIQPRSLGVL